MTNYEKYIAIQTAINLLENSFPDAEIICAGENGEKQIQILCDENYQSLSKKIINRKNTK